MEISKKRKREALKAEKAAKARLEKGDRVRVTKCPGTKRTITFSHWDGCWMVSKTGIDDYHPINVDRVNGLDVDFTKKQLKKPDSNNEDEPWRELFIGETLELKTDNDLTPF